MLFIFNPISGKGSICTRLYDIIDIFTKGGYDVLCRPTLHAKESHDIVEQYADWADLIVCGGGDGTLDEVVSAVLAICPDKQVGYLPSGSTNDFANSLAISSILPTAARDITEGENYQCDIGLFNESHFVYVAAFGFFTDISYETDQELKNRIGHLAYILEAGKRLFDMPSYHVTVHSGERTITGHFTFGMVTNARFVGGMRNLVSQDVDMNDGLFEVTLVRTPSTPLELSSILSTLLSRDQERSPFVETFQTDKITLTSEEPIPWTLDGEYGGTVDTVEIKNLYKVLNLVLNRKKK